MTAEISKAKEGNTVKKIELNEKTLTAVNGGIRIRRSDGRCRRNEKRLIPEEERLDS